MSVYFWAKLEEPRRRDVKVGAIDPASLLDHRPVKAAPPPGQAFRAASGRLESFSETLAAQGVSPMPDWQPDARETADAARSRSPPACCSAAFSATGPATRRGPRDR